MGEACRGKTGCLCGPDLELIVQACCAITVAAGRAGAADCCQRCSVFHGRVSRRAASPHPAECHPAAVQDLPGGHAHTQPDSAHRSAFRDFAIRHAHFPRLDVYFVHRLELGRQAGSLSHITYKASCKQAVGRSPLTRRSHTCAGLLEQEQWTAALVARDFQRSVDGMERKAQAFLHTNGNGDSAHLSHVLPASDNGQVAKQLQNGGTSAHDKGMACPPRMASLFTSRSSMHCQSLCPLTSTPGLHYFLQPYADGGSE